MKRATKRDPKEFDEKIEQIFDDCDDDDKEIIQSVRNNKIYINEHDERIEEVINSVDNN